MKKSKWAALLLAAVMALGVAGCGGDTEDTAAEGTESNTAVEEKIEEEVGEEATRGYSDFVGSDTYNAIEQIVNENMADYNPTLEYDEESNILLLNLTAPEGTTEAIEAGLEGDVKTAWDNMVTSFADLTKSGKETLETSGYEDMSFAVMLLSDTDSEMSFYAALDGTEVYNVANDAQ